MHSLRCHLYICRYKTSALNSPQKNSLTKTFDPPNNLPTKSIDDSAPKKELKENPLRRSSGQLIETKDPNNFKQHRPIKTRKQTPLQDICLNG